MASGILFSLLGLGALCALVYRFAVYAVPTFVGFAVGLWALDTGAGVFGGVVTGVIAAMATLSVGQLAFGAARSIPARALVAFVFAIPAAYAGYHVMLGLGHYGVPSDTWRQVFAAVGAVVIGCTAIARLTASVGPVHGDLRP